MEVNDLRNQHFISLKIKLAHKDALNHMRYFSEEIQISDIIG